MWRNTAVNCYHKIIEQVEKGYKFERALKFEGGLEACPLSGSSFCTAHYQVQALKTGAPTFTSVFVVLTHHSEAGGD
jgi:hypothetical protein